MKPIMLSVSILLCASVAHAAGEDVSTYTCKKMAADAKIRASLKRDTSIYDLALWVSSFTCKNVVFGADVAKHAMRITMITPNEMTPKQAEDLFTAALEAQGLDVSEKGGTIMVKLGASMSRGCPDLNPPSEDGGSTTGTTVDPDSGTNAFTLPVKKVDDLHYEVSRKDLQSFLDGEMFARSVRVVPAVKDGKADGFKLYAIRPNSPFAQLGFQNGDGVHSVNGVALLTVDGALEAYKKVKTDKTLRFAITRRGKDVELVITVTDP
jgi:hypothetical protein